jgi:SAM-dependent methyltransferase
MSNYEPFVEDYDLWAAHMTEDVAWYVELAREAAEPVVELAVGTGRVAIPVARETGKRVIGIDSSPAMLAEARRRAAEAGVELDLREGDMRDLSLEERVELVYCPFRSLLHLPTWRDKRTVFERVAASLSPRGRFAFNAFVFSPFVAARNHGAKTHHGEAWELVHQIPADNRIDITRGRGDQTVGTLSIWWATRSEWEGLLEAAGLETEALYGGFRREPFGADSQEFVWVARKP